MDCLTGKPKTLEKHTQTSNAVLVTRPSGGRESGRVVFSIAQWLKVCERRCPLGNPVLAPRPPTPNKRYARTRHVRVRQVLLHPDYVRDNDACVFPPRQHSPLDSPNGSIPSLALAQVADQPGVRTLLAHTSRKVWTCLHACSFVFPKASSIKQSDSMEFNYFDGRLGDLTCRCSCNSMWYLGRTINPSDVVESSCSELCQCWYDLGIRSM